MFTPIKKVPVYKKVDPKIVNVLIDRLNTLSKITTGGGITVQTSPMGVHLHSQAIRTGSLVRRAITTQAAPADTKITANLYDLSDTEITEGADSGIDVYCDITGSANLNAALPYLADNQDITVYYKQEKWWCTTIFRIADICA